LNCVLASTNLHAAINFSFQGQRSRSNVTLIWSLLADTITHIPTTLHQFLISSFSVFTQTHRCTLLKTIPAFCKHINLAFTNSEKNSLYRAITNDCIIHCQLQTAFEDLFVHTIVQRLTNCYICCYLSLKLRFTAG